MKLVVGNQRRIQEVVASCQEIVQHIKKNCETATCHFYIQIWREFNNHDMLLESFRGAGRWILLPSNRA